MYGLSVTLMLATSLIFPGIIIRTKSLFSGRRGPGVLQPLKDIWRLLRKGTVYSETTSIIFRIAPSIYFASVLMAVFLVPINGNTGVLSFNGDFIFFVYTLALGKFFMILGAMDTGSSFEGMGASREALFSMLVEPAFFILIGSFALLTGHASFYEIFNHLHFGSYIGYSLSALATFVLIIVAMVENSRMPIDDPKTHLELTMIHEVMILDNSGFDLGLIMYTTNLKFVLYGTLIANFLIPAEMSFGYSIVIFISIQILFAVIVGSIESFMARFRMTHNPQFILTLSSVSILIFLGVLLILGRIA